MKKKSKWKLKVALLRDRLLVLAVISLIASIVCESMVPDPSVWHTFCFC